MMKKFLTIAITLVVLASLVCMMPVSAATNALTAKANTPTLDGKIDAGEYGEAYLIKDLAGAGWTGAGDNKDNKAATPENISYAFAWDAKGLYIAVSGYFANLNPQLNANPNGAITDATKQGLFFTFGADGKVTQHNHASKAGNANAKIGETKIGDGVMEVFIPVEAFQIAGNENFAMEAGHKLLAIPAGHPLSNTSDFSYFCAEGWTGTWTVDGINFGTIELLAVPGADTGDFGIIALAFVALSSIAAKKRKDA